MEPQAGMSIKERLALLQASNKNPSLAGPMKAPPPHKTTTPANTDANANKTSTNGPSVPSTLALKPAFKAGGGGGSGGGGDLSPGAGNATQQDGENTPQLAFKLRPTGGVGGGGKGIIPVKSPTVPDNATSPVTKFTINCTPNAAGGGGGVGGGVGGGRSTGVAGRFPAAASNSPGGIGVTPLVPKKPGGVAGAGGSGESAGGPGAATTAVAMRDRSNASNAGRPPSIRERMAALKEKAGDGGDGIGGGADGTVKSPTDPAQKKFPMFPPKSDGSVVKPSDLLKSLQEAAKRKKASEAFLRKSDGKRFRKVDVETARDSFPAPPKPPALDNVDLVTFLSAYAAAKEAKLKTDSAQGDPASAAGEEGEGEMEELYVEAESEVVPLRVRGRGSVKRATSARISEIPEFTEEEEEEELYTDGRSAEAPAATEPGPPDELYDDCSSAANPVQNNPVPEFEDPDEIYEPLDDDLDSKIPPPEPEPEPVSSPGPADGKKAGKKEKEKDGKKDKKKETKEEKEKKKREEEIKKQRAKFGLKEGAEKLGEGVVKNNASAGVFSKDLPVSKGEIVVILRMDNNPSGKWLVQNDQGKLGFVSSSNLEVATPAIRQSYVHTLMKTPLLHMEYVMMTAAASDALPGDNPDPEELYEPLPDMDEIYEEL